MSPIEVVSAHIPTLTREDEREIIALGAPGPIETARDPANYAIRTCLCGQRIDGFYEYVDHLRDELRKAGHGSPEDVDDLPN